MPSICTWGDAPGQVYFFQVKGQREQQQAAEVVWLHDLHAARIPVKVLLPPVMLPSCC